jgi:Right handed beta helix region/RTX calcium-binding nonapeptide repeat (4 copies)
MSRRVRVATGAGLSLGAVLAAPAVADAEEITVTNLNEGGNGSLRDAVQEADLDPDSDRILFASSLSGTIELADDLIAIDSPMEILGPGARTLTVDATPGAGRAFSVYAGAGQEAVISGLTVNGASGYSYGGAIFHGTGELTIERSTITGGQASGDGGGLWNESTGDGTTIIESTISGNTATLDGGGFYNDDVDLEVRNSTISGNEAGQQGGGGYLNLPDPSTVLIANSTVTENEAGADFGGGGLYESTSGATIRGSIIANNSDGAGSAPDLDDGPWSTSFSLIGDTTGAVIVDDGGNVLDVGVNLAPLANNGGPTNTHAFKSSPARNAGPGDAPPHDQRGAPRKGQPDIGAYELTKCKGVAVNFVGTDGKDKFRGTKKKDGMLGLEGNDVLKGKKGKDGLCGGPGKDKLNGGPGKDKLNGGPGKDKLKGGPGKDTLVGGPGKDKEIQ